MIREKDSYRAGVLGELKAARYLRKKHMKISAMRYRAGGGEIDIIARNGEEIVFVEVKYRPEGVLGEGVRAVNREKQNRIRSAAKVYLVQKQLSNHPLRFDVIEITPAGIRHLERAF